MSLLLLLTANPNVSTKLYLRSTQTNGIGATYYDLDIVAGALSDTAVVDTALNGTDIQFTKTAGGSIAQFISGRAPVGGFTLTSTDISLWLLQSSLLNNIGGRYRIFKRTAAGVETDITATPFDDGIEATATNAEYTWTGDVTDTLFAEDDRVLLKVYVTNIGVMAMGTATLTFNGADGLEGDSFLNIYPKAVFKANGTGVTGTVATSQAQTVAASGTYTPPPITGTATTSQAQTVSANGTTGVTGTVATSQAQTISANGTYTPPAISGTVTTSQAQAVAATGSFGNGITGTVTSSQAQSTTATGTVTSPSVTTGGTTSGRFVVKTDGKLKTYFKRQDAIRAINASELRALKLQSNTLASEKIESQPQAVQQQPQVLNKPVLYDVDAMLLALQQQELSKQQDMAAFIQAYEDWLDEDDIEFLLMAV